MSSFQTCQSEKYFCFQIRMGDRPGAGRPAGSKKVNPNSSDNAQCLVTGCMKIQLKKNIPRHYDGVGFDADGKAVSQDSDLYKMLSDLNKLHTDHFRRKNIRKGMQLPYKALPQISRIYI